MAEEPPDREQQLSSIIVINPIPTRSCHLGPGRRLQISTNSGRLVTY